MIKSSVCDYSDAYIRLKETITVVGAGTTEAAAQEIINKQYSNIL